MNNAGSFNLYSTIDWIFFSVRGFITLGVITIVNILSCHGAKSVFLYLASLGRKFITDLIQLIGWMRSKVNV